MKVEVAVLSSPSLIVPMVSVDVKQPLNARSELRNCVKVEVAVLWTTESLYCDYSSLIVRTVSVDVKQH